MICVECSESVDSLYTYYSDHTILATTCPRCGHFADKYIEADAVVVALDLLLLRPGAIRHVVFNELDRGDGHALHEQTQRIIVLVTLFDVYLQWAQCEKSDDPVTQSFISAAPMLVQYMAFLGMCTLDTAVVHAIVRWLARRMLGWPKPGVVSTAVVLGSAFKLLPILTLIWDYDMPLVSSMVRWAVGFCLIEVLAVVLQCGYIWSTVLTAATLGARWLTHESVWFLLLRG